MTDVASALDLQVKYDAAIRRAVEILKKANPVRIIRFGSASCGPLHEDSDLDLCVDVERTDDRHIRHIEYYTETRYPDTLRFGAAFTQAETDIATTCAETVLDFIRPKIENLRNEEA
jgi:predicted nucleotidyltransferase